MIKGIVFDLDGVLVFTDHYHYLAWKAIADQEGIPFDEKINDRLRGVSRMDSLAIILEKAHKTYSEEEKQKLADQKNTLYRKYLKQMTPKDVKDEVRTTLEALHKKGIKLAIGSSSKNATMILEQTNLSHYFDQIVDGNKITHSKPDPEVFLLGAKALGFESKDCLVVEDAEAGIEAAKAGGFKAVGIGPASHDKRTDYPIASIKDILSIVGSKIRLEHLCKVYPNGVKAVKDFSLEINDDEFIVFVGPSGCGKSTVLRMIAGLEEITSGELYLDGKNISDEEPDHRNIAMVFQNYALYPQLTVRKNIAFPLEMRHVCWKYFFDFAYRKKRHQEINAAVEEAAAKIGLTPYLDRKPRNLSGGQRQRVALGRAIVRHPSVFLLDEPLSNLDAKMRVQMRTEISKLHNDLKCVFIYVTHDQVEAMTMGTRIVVMKDGTIQQIASPSELYVNPINKFVAGFIGTPQMNFFNGVIHEKDGHYSVTFGEGKTCDIPAERMAHFDKNYLEKTVTIGIRPKEISAEGDPSFAEQGIHAKIILWEQLGEETLLYCQIKGKEGELIASVKGLLVYQNGQEVSLSFNFEHVCLFDKESEKSLLNE